MEERRELEFGLGKVSIAAIQDVGTGHYGILIHPESEPHTVGEAIPAESDVKYERTTGDTILWFRDISGIRVLQDFIEIAKVSILTEKPNMQQKKAVAMVVEFVELPTQRKQGGERE